MDESPEQQRPQRRGPAGPRVKTYSGASGYVYQYAFVGQRDGDGEMEYIFEVSWSRGERRSVSVWVSDAAVRDWTVANGRELTSSERYGVSKMALRNAFDARTPDGLEERIAPEAAEVEAILEELGV